MGRVGITDTTLRDGHQSLLATRMKTEDMLPILEKHDAVGFRSLEMWGGATFDTCMRFCGDDPWVRLKEIRSRVKTPLQMLLRGQNVVGYRNYADDVLTEFIKKSVAFGMDIFRIFDALNDVRNLEKAMEVVVAEGAHAQPTVVYTISPVHDTAYFVKLAQTLEGMGAHSIAIKDMAGILAPYPAFEIVSAMKNAGVKVPIHLHCHYTSGMGSMAYLKAIEAGVDVVDCAISTMALQTSQPAIEPMCASLEGSDKDPGFDMKLLTEIADYWKEVREKYAEFDVASKSIDTNVMIYQIPGGMMSNFISQLSQQNALGRLPEVLEELPKCREDFGYPPLVTPTSQIVGTQSVLNVLFGRFKMNTAETTQYMRGYYGQPPAPINEEVRKSIIGDEQPITCRPADMLEPEMPGAREQAKDIAESEEDIISYVLYPQVAPDFFKQRKG
ncbi:MAG: pyruvate carboxylase subunit B [Peptococcaceae bacterium]|nr:pyruvate carboxylase subunit B [Peptococcaceae bacterium]